VDEGAARRLYRDPRHLSPAVPPPLYQGGELWDFSLVGPDSRCPVDWDLRRALLEDVTACSLADLAEQWHDGREKLFVTRRLPAG